MKITAAIRTMLDDALADERAIDEATERAIAAEITRRERQALTRELDAAEYAHRCAIDAAAAAVAVGDELNVILAHRRVAACAAHVADIRTAMKGQPK
jgi:hypothetical protein